jgi:UTP-glucose-1-phosphate uridylyltransferase
LLTSAGSTGCTPTVSVLEKPAVEKAPSHIAVMGRYILTPAIFKALKTIGKGAGNTIFADISRIDGLYADRFCTVLVIDVYEL